MIPVYSKFIDCFVFKRIQDDIHFLLLYRSEGRLYPKTWQNIQGKIEKDETAYEAAKRELFEETRLEPIAFWNLDFQNTYYYPKTNEMYIFPVFVAEVSDDKVILSQEHDDYQWCSKDEAITHLIWRSQKQSIQQIYDEFFINPNDQKLEFTRL
jgi:dATP pyrophosphohydrolase